MQYETIRYAVRENIAIVTMNRAHTTHYTNSPDPSIRHVLRGWNPDGGAAQHDITLEELKAIYPLES